MTVTLDDLDKAVADFATAKITTTNVLTNLIKLFNAGFPVNVANLTQLVVHFDEMTTLSNVIRADIAEMKALGSTEFSIGIGQGPDPELTVT